MIISVDPKAEILPHTARFKAGALLGSPARTGRDNRSSIAVINIAQQNRGNLCNVIPGCLFKSRCKVNILDIYIYSLAEFVGFQSKIEKAKSAYKLNCPEGRHISLIFGLSSNFLISFAFS